METLSFKVTLKRNVAGESQNREFFRCILEIGESQSFLGVCVTTVSDEYCQIPFALFDPKGNLRILKTGEGGKGEVKNKCVISHSFSDSGGISGCIPKGNWVLILHKRRMDSDAEAKIEIWGKGGKKMPDNHNKHLSFSSLTLNSKPGWYSGELHVHSNHSTGRDSIKTILDVAKEQNLDFISITDHFTASHWQEEEEYCDKGIVMLQSMELSGDRGHANLQGIRTAKNPYVDDDGFIAKALGTECLPNMESIADSVHEEGGLFTINHPDGDAVSSWRYREFPIEKADLIEVWCTACGDVSFRLPAIWDSYLSKGFRLIGVCSSDSHKAKDHPIWALGKIRTWVYARELSQKGIMEGLKKGNVFMAKGTAKLDFTAKSENEEYHMGETAGQFSDTTFNITLENHPRGNLFIYASGHLEQTRFFKGGKREQYSFSLSRNTAGVKKEYVRLEYYEMKGEPRFWGDAPRMPDTLTLLSNPIWIRK